VHLVGFIIRIYYNARSSECQTRVRNNIIIGNLQSEVAKDNLISLHQPNPVEENCKSEHDTPTIWAIGSD